MVRYLTFGRMALPVAIVLAVVLFTDRIVSLRVDRSVCTELQNHLENLDKIQMKTIDQYRPTRENPPQFAEQLARIDNSDEPSHQKLNAVDDYIQELKSHFREDEKERPESAGMQISCFIYGLCSGRKERKVEKREEKLEQVASTYAQFYRAKKLWENGNRFYAIVQVRKLRSQRQSVRGVPMSDIFKLEHELLTGMAERCSSDPRSMFGDGGRDFDYWVASKLLLDIFDPESAEGSEPQQETWRLVYKLVLYAKTKLKKFGYDLDYQSNSDKEDEKGEAKEESKKNATTE